MACSQFHYPTIVPGFPADVPAHQRVWQGRAVAALMPGLATRWRFDHMQVPPGWTAWLRLIPALDCRVPLTLTVSNGAGDFMARRGLGLPVPFEPLDLPLDLQHNGPADQLELQLRVDGEVPLHLHVTPGAPSVDGISDDSISSGLVLQPPDCTVGELEEAFLQRLCSLGALTAFGWMCGCVHDGLWALRQAHPEDERYPRALERLLGAWFTADGVHYESPTSLPVDNVLTNSEASLPWAVLAQLSPDHPSIDLAIDFFRSRQLAGHDESFTCEGNYTFTYPMLTIALSTGMPELVEQAWGNYRQWQAMLKHDDGIYLRNHQGRLSFRNWPRGWCWYMLGQVRALEVASKANVTLPPDRLDDLQDTVRRALALQRADGLWSNFMSEAAQLPDTAGSAGIAAAMVRAARHGWLPAPLAAQAVAAGERTLQTLWHYVTADGFLTGVAPSNKREGGICLQRQPERSSQQYSLGLMANLLAAVTLPQA